VKQLILLLAASLAFFACKEKTSAPAAPTPAPVVAATPAPTATLATPALPPNHPAMGATAANGNIGGKITGTIAETFDAAGYTYMRLSTPSGDEWAAVRQTPVKKGQKVTMNVQMTAEKFESKTLKRTFDRILFGAIENGGAAPVSQAQQHMSAPAAADNTPIKVEKAGKTVAEVWAARAELKDGKIAVRGKVVKFLGGIMGTNWIHLRDGSGSNDKGDNDLAVTTNDTAAIGDVVLVTGVVHVDKDFGAGYRYPVIIEDATVTK
jgi:hypothetical protein